MNQKKTELIDSVLYLVEGSESKEKTKEELKQPDPDNKEAVFASLLERSKDEIKDSK